MSIKIYHVDNRSYLEKYSLGDLLQHLPDDISARAYRYKFRHSAYNFVLGRLLLQRALLDAGYSSSLLSSLRYGSSGKPFLVGINFSLSHSGSKVVCAFSTLDITLGIDIEEVQAISFSHLRHFFTAKEWSSINQSATPLISLYWYWTAKESTLKALGAGLGGLAQIRIQNAHLVYFGDILFHLQSIDLGHSDYLVSLCTSISSKDIVLVPFELGQP